MPGVGISFLTCDMPVAEFDSLSKRLAAARLPSGGTLLAAAHPPGKG
jgi:hypothetical protein